jgi:SAM-dependent methyltransferase
MLKGLKIRFAREQFLPTRWGIVLNRNYIIRRGLYKAISHIATDIRGEVLDFGCGSKPYEPLFPNATRYVGVDLEQSGHNHQTSTIDFYYDGEHLPFADCCFDAIVSFEVFEHVFNLEEVLSEIRRVLKTGGNLLLSIPFVWGEHEIPYDFARYTTFGIAYILRKCGFEVVQVEKTTSSFLAIAQMLIEYLSCHVSPKKGIPWKLFHLSVICPITVAALFLYALLPKGHESFCNSVILARKSEK